MYGPAAPASPRTGSGAGVIFVRVLLAALPLVSLGILAWGTTLRIAIMRQRLLEWLLFGLHVPLSFGCFATVGELPEESAWSDAALGVLLLTAIGSMAWFLVVDIRYQRERTAKHVMYDANPYARPQPYPPTPRISPELDDLSDLLRRKDDKR
ncbi:hypothetical protein AB0M28_28950 [Streptomyces sp. NPDC051940]|uniref:hypothetical protein n=1 Tax=Streptomyces sp. NPDC051940 TaxID=3155675 RepID=UPI0034153C13